jgi:hypothetical protein
MPTITLTDELVSLRFTAGERIAGLVRDLDIPVRHVTSAVAVPDGFEAVRGLRAPGLGVPGRRKIGTWRGRGNRSLVAVRAHRSALVLDLEGHHYQRVVVTDEQATAHAQELAQRQHPSSGEA